jgi:rhodanese-related sulfurtransferase
MHASKFLRILVVTLALSGYSVWARTQQQKPTVNLADDHSPGGIRLLRLTEAEALWHEPSTIFLDVRSATDYEFGHIAGAILLPEGEFEQRFPELRPRLERARAIVVYCKSEDCGKSLWAAIRLRNEGLKQAAIYPAGWNEWYLHGLPSAGAGR